MKHIRLPALLVLLTVFIGADSVYSQKLKAEDIVAKHLDSIGTKEKRVALKNMIAVGTATSSVTRSATYNNFGKTSGSAVFLSEANKIYFGMKFDTVNYPFDEVIYDGKSVNTASIIPGRRSALGYYILNTRDIIKDGLFGGTLSTAWGLFDLQAHGAKVDTSGKKKINGREAYVLGYRFDDTSPLSVKLYFDAENFQHIRTEYRRVFPVPLSRNPSESSFQVQTIHTLTENFSNYKTVNGLTLPHSYKLNLLLDSKVVDEIEWNFGFSEFRFNQKIDATSFEIK